MTEPTFNAVPDGGGWSVRVVWPSGKVDAIPGFTNQYQALEWIKQDAANWLTDRILNDPSI